MFAHSTDHLKNPDTTKVRGRLLHRSWWVHDLPRLVALCRLFGHLPVVDGTQSRYETGPGPRWVCCARCGTRPDPQGKVDPAEWNIGARYTGPWTAALPAGEKARRQVLQSLKGVDNYLPGPWREAVGNLTAELVIGKGPCGGSGLSFTVGHAGDESTLSTSFRLHGVAQLYLSTQGFGEWIRRRVNDADYEAREISAAVDMGSLRIRLWAPTMGSWEGLPRWRALTVRVDPRDILLGEHRYAYKEASDLYRVALWLPHGDRYMVDVQLKKETAGRKHGPKKRSWVVSWSCPPGIPIRPHQDDRDGVTGATVRISNNSVTSGLWQQEAVAAIGVQITRWRTDHGMQHLHQPPPADWMPV